MNEILKIFVEWVTITFDFVGVILVTWGGVLVIWSFTKGELSKSDQNMKRGHEFHQGYRCIFANKLLLALEFFLAVDIIRTVVSPTWDSLGKLAALVAIRTVLAYFLNKEVRER